MWLYGCGDTMTQTWLPGPKIFPRGTNFFDDPIRIRPSYRKCNKKILSWGGGIHPPGWGGGMTLLEFALVSDNAIKNFAVEGSTTMYAWGNPPQYVCLVGVLGSPSPSLKYKVAQK